MTSSVRSVQLGLQVAQIGLDRLLSAFSGLVDVADIAVHVTGALLIADVRTRSGSHAPGLLGGLVGASWATLDGALQEAERIVEVDGAQHPADVDDVAAAGQV